MDAAVVMGPVHGARHEDGGAGDDGTVFGAFTTQTPPPPAT